MTKLQVSIVVTNDSRQFTTKGKIRKKNIINKKEQKMIKLDKNVKETDPHNPMRCQSSSLIILTKQHLLLLSYWLKLKALETNQELFLWSQKNSYHSQTNLDEFPLLIQKTQGS